MLFFLRIPNVTMTKDEGGIELDVSDDPHDYKQIDVSSAPLVVTVNKVKVRILSLKITKISTE